MRSAIGTTTIRGGGSRSDGTIVDRGTQDEPPQLGHATDRDVRVGTMSKIASQLASQQSAARSR